MPVHLQRRRILCHSDQENVVPENAGKLYRQRRVSTMAAYGMEDCCSNQSKRLAVVMKKLTVWSAGIWAWHFFGNVDHGLSTPKKKSPLCAEGVFSRVRRIFRDH